MIYLDDILIFSDSFDAHSKHLNEVLHVLKQHNFTLNPDKCLRARESVDFLSHTITKDAIIPLKERIQAILSIPQPKTLAQANRFIGKVGWYRKFIPGFSKIAAPIHEVTNKLKSRKHEFFWRDPQIRAANHIKRLLTSAVAAKLPSPNSTVHLSNRCFRICNWWRAQTSCQWNNSLQLFSVTAVE